MGFPFNENFDGVTAPALPADVTAVTGTFSTSTTHSRSGTNSLTYVVDGTNAAQCSFGIDTVSGNVSLSAWVYYPSQGTNQQQLDFGIRSPSSTNSYLVSFQVGAADVTSGGGGGPFLRCYKVVAGTVTTFTTQFPSGISAANWYRVGVAASGTTISYLLQRDSDSKYWNGTAWVTGSVYAYTTTDSGLTGSGQAFMYSFCGATPPFFIDDLSYQSTAAVATSFTITGTSAGPAGAASVPFSWTPIGGASSSTVTQTPVSGVTFTPSSETWAADSSVKTFTVTKSAAGTASIAGTSSGAETMPSALTYTAKATVIRTYYATGGIAGTLPTYAISNIDGTYFSLPTTTGVVDLGTGIFSIAATVPSDLVGTITWNYGATMLAFEALNNIVATGTRSGQRRRER